MTLCQCGIRGADVKKGGYKMKPGLVYLGFSTDFLIEKADAWRSECWKMIKERSDCTFLFLTKRIERFSQCIPEETADRMGIPLDFVVSSLNVAK